MVEPSQLPRPPFHHIPGLPNFRDLGGYEISHQPSSAVRRGIVFRSSEPSQLTDEGIARLHHLDVRHVYDLRSVDEIERGALSASGLGRVREWRGAQRSFVPIFLNQDYSPEAVALRFRNYASEGTEGFVQAYGAILRAATAPDHPWAPFRTILSHLASEEPPGPVLIHCTAGKDRTGVICALILSLCGVPDDVVADEYSLTDIGLQNRREEFIAGILKIPALRGNRPGAERMIGSRKENMLATLIMIRREHGSVEDFVLNHCLLSHVELDRMRRNLTVDRDEGELGHDRAGHAESF